jgi:hypothetical protein
MSTKAGRRVILIVNSNSALSLTIDTSFGIKNKSCTVHNKADYCMATVYVHYLYTCIST